MSKNNSESPQGIRINVSEFLYRMDRAAAMVEAASALANSDAHVYTPSIVLDMVISEIADLKNIIDVAEVDRLVADARARAGGVK
jgi:hypothetical protein